MIHFRTVALWSAALAGFSLLLIAGHEARAAGFYIQEQSASGLGASFAGVAAMPRDASTVYYNPAGMTYLDGAHAQAGANALYARSDMDNTGSTLFGAPVTGGDGGNPVGLVGIPNLYLTQQASENFWLGISVTFPFGLGSEYNSDWFGRFDSIKSDLQTIDIQPSMAVRINDWLKLGGGISYQRVTAELTSAVTDGVEGISTLKGEDTSWGYTVGLIMEPGERTRIGVNYRSAVNHELEGSASVVGTAGSDFDTPVTAELDLPDIASLAVAHELNDRWRLLGQANWFGWNNFEAITVRSGAGIISNIIQNYQTTWSFSAGAEYKWDDSLTLRAGYQFDETPTTDEYRTSRTPDGDRNWLSAGGTYNLDSGFSVDFAATYIAVKDEEINLSRNSGLAAVRADVESDVSIVGLALNYKF
jgi:long-chain fatty acid transport protein